MNDLSEMWTICHACPYWEVCEPPYNCVATENKYRQTEQDNGGGGRMSDWIHCSVRMPKKTGIYLCKIKCPKGEWTENLYWSGEDWFTNDMYNETSTPYVVEWQPYNM